jgi:hypothetical protein
LAASATYDLASSWRTQSSAKEYEIRPFISGRHQTADVVAQFEDSKIRLKRISYVEQDIGFSPDYSRCVGVKIVKACFYWGIVPSLWFRQLTHEVNW